MFEFGQVRDIRDLTENLEIRTSGQLLGTGNCKFNLIILNDCVVELLSGFNSYLKTIIVFENYFCYIDQLID